jgi:hypothetical protein
LVGAVRLTNDVPLTDCQTPLLKPVPPVTAVPAVTPEIQLVELVPPQDGWVVYELLIVAVPTPEIPAVEVPACAPVEFMFPQEKVLVMVVLKPYDTPMIPAFPYQFEVVRFLRMFPVL